MAECDPPPGRPPHHRGAFADGAVVAWRGWPGGEPAANGVLVPVPPVEGFPGPVLFENPTLTFVPKGTIPVTLAERWPRGVEFP